MDRHPRRWILQVALSLTAAGILASQGGCVGALTTAMYLIKGNNVPAEYNGLKDKRVAVVCRPLAELDFSSSNAATDIAAQVSQLLKANIRKIKLVDQREVAAWTDEHSWDEFTEIGEALDAEMVLGIDLEGFSLYQGQTLYQGKANATIKVFDMEKDGEIVFRKTLPQTVYPPNSSIATQDKPEDEFRRQFVAVVADQIGRYFYKHDPRADFAQDSRALD